MVDEMQKIARSDKFINIGTHNLRVVISEVPSKATIILEAGGGECSDAYQNVQDTLAYRTKIRVMSYDRSGFGKSELGPNDFKAIDEVQALKKSLELLGFEGNYILVGHSYGGFLIQLFVAQYPELVKGLVLVDPMNVKFVDRWGLDNLNAVTPYFENPANNSEKAGNRMTDSFSKALDLLRGKELPKEISTILITAGNFPMMPELWRTCHQEMVENSEKHKLIVAEGCSHQIWIENSKLVQDKIFELVKSVNLT